MCWLELWLKVWVGLRRFSDFKSGRPLNHTGISFECLAYINPYSVISKMASYSLHRLVIIPQCILVPSLPQVNSALVLYIHPHNVEENRTHHLIHQVHSDRAAAKQPLKKQGAIQCVWQILPVSRLSLLYQLSLTFDVNWAKVDLMLVQMV